MKRYLVGTDVGTSGTKSVLMDADGNILAEDCRTYPLTCAQAGWAEQSALDWERAVFASIRAVVAQSKASPADVGAICVSGLFAGSGVPVDRDMRPIRDAIIWMDRRATREAAWVEESIGTEALFEVTGNGNDAYFGFNKMLWIRENEPEIWSRARYFLPSNCYIVYRLTGELAVDHTSAANIGGVYDLERRCWSAPLLDRLGIDAQLLPDVFLEPDEFAGTLTREAAEKTGLVPGIPVCAGCTDCLASNLAVGVTEENQQSAIIGTSINWGVLHRSRPTTPALVSMPNAVDAKSMLYTYGGVTTAGALTKWFLETLAPYTGAQSAVKRTSFNMLDGEAAEIPAGSDGLLVLPYFMGERSPLWDAGARGVFCGLSLLHTRAHLYRAVLESAAFAARHIRESSRLFLDAGDVCVVSGGAARSRLWMQILADVTGMKIRRSQFGEQAPIGDALIAGVASGVFCDYSAIHAWCRYDADICPDPERHDRYSAVFEQYKRLYAETRGCVAALTAISR